MVESERFNHMFETSIGLVKSNKMPLLVYLEPSTL